MTKTDIGIYIHIPFCNSKCSYCNFFSQIRSPEVRKAYVSSLVKQIKAYSEEIRPSTVYIGGGTPSVLSVGEFEEIFSALSEKFDMSGVSEFTVEANPESVSEELLNTLKNGRVDRISLGIQSFSDKELEACNRKHRAKDAENAILKIRKAGFENISADVIIGLPFQTDESFENSLKSLISLGVDHVSAYILKVEEKTLFSLKNISEPDEETAERRYLFASGFLSENGFEHYEISNFAKNQKRGKHNFSYWQGREYAAFGTGASGYENGVRYRFGENISDFIKADGNPEKIVEEILSEENMKEEKIMLSLRTSDGIPLELLGENCRCFAETLKKQNFAEIKDGTFRLTPKGFLVSNGIIAEILARNDI